MVCDSVDESSTAAGGPERSLYGSGLFRGCMAVGLNRGILDSTTVLAFAILGSTAFSHGLGSTAWA